MNIVIKVLALILAILLWFNVITKKQYEYDLKLPVTSIDFPSGLGPVTPFPDSVEVKVFAEGRKLLKDDWKKAGVRIKAGRMHRGANTLDLNLETVSLNRSEDITLLELVGNLSYTVQLDRIDSTLRPIASLLAAVPAKGYMIVRGEGGINPIQTQVIGPAQVLRQIDSIYTDQKIIDDLKEPVTVTLGLQTPPGLAVTLGHDSATIEIDIDKITRRRFENIPVNPAKNLSRHKVIIDPAEIAVEVEGPATLIDTLTNASITASFSSAPAVVNGYIVPTVGLPENCRQVSISPDSIRVIVGP